MGAVPLLPRRLAWLLTLPADRVVMEGIVRRSILTKALVTVCAAALAAGTAYAAMAAAASGGGADAVNDGLSVSIFDRSSIPQDALPDALVDRGEQMGLDAASTRLAYQSQDLSVYVGKTSDGASLCLFLDSPNAAGASCGPASWVAAGKTTLQRSVVTMADGKAIAWLVGIVGDSAKVTVDGQAVDVTNNVFATSISVDAPANVAISTIDGSYTVSANSHQPDNGAATITIAPVDSADSPHDPSDATGP